MFIFLYIIIGWVWQFPQTLIGFLISKAYKNIHTGPGGFKYVLVKSGFIPYMCMGEYLFVGNTELVRFLYGRGILSRKFGLFFIPLISIPSLIMLGLGKNWFLTFYGTRKSIEYGLRTKAEKKKILLG